MILNFLKKYLNEEFLTADNVNTSSYKGYIEFFKNPTPREIRSIAYSEDNDEKSIRLGGSDGNLYAWMYKLYHSDAMDILKTNWIFRFEYTYPNEYITFGSGTLAPALVWNKYGGLYIDKIKNTITNVKELRTQDGEVIYSWKSQESEV